MDSSFRVLKQFIIKVCENIQALNELKIVNGELSSSNISVDLDVSKKEILDLKIGQSDSSYFYDGQLDHSLVKPSVYEYTPPEIL